jgi:hypothetical protein
MVEEAGIPGILEKKNIHYSHVPLFVQFHQKITHKGDIRIIHNLRLTRYEGINSQIMIEEQGNE